MILILKLIFESISNSKANKEIKFRIPEKIDLDLLYEVHQKEYDLDSLDPLLLLTIYRWFCDGLDR